MAKKKYWQLFAKLYSKLGSTIDVVMTNSTWTQSHIKTLWEPYRIKRSKSIDIDVVFPPVAVEEVIEAVPVSESSEKAFRSQLLLDAIAEKEEIQVSQEELTQYLIQAASQYGMEPAEFIKIKVRRG